MECVFERTVMGYDRLGRLCVVDGGRVAALLGLACGLLGPGVARRLLRGSVLLGRGVRHLLGVLKQTMKVIISFKLKVIEPINCRRLFYFAAKPAKLCFSTQVITSLMLR
jgi:hypothetical protein